MRRSLSLGSVLLLSLVSGVIGVWASPGRRAAASQPALRDLEIVWSRRAYLPGKQRSYLQLWRMRGDGSGARQLTSGRYNRCLQEVDRQGKLRYLRDSRVDGVWEEVDADGRHRRGIRRPRGIGAGEVAAAREADLVSPNRRWVARRSGNGEAGALSIIDVKSGKQTLEMTYEGLAGLSWSPRGNLLAATIWEAAPGKPDDPLEVLRVFDVSRGTSERVECPAAFAYQGALGTLAWSQDERFISADVGTTHEGHLWVYDRQTPRWAYLENGQEASWSPRGDFLLYQTIRDLAPFEGRRLWVSHVFVYDASTGRRYQLTRGVSCNHSPRWLPSPHRGGRDG